MSNTQPETVNFSIFCNPEEKKTNKKMSVLKYELCNGNLIDNRNYRFLFRIFLCEV